MKREKAASPPVEKEALESCLGIKEARKNLRFTAPSRKLAEARRGYQALVGK